jgi:hypothetical protein
MLCSGFAISLDSTGSTGSAQLSGVLCPRLLHAVGRYEKGQIRDELHDTGVVKNSFSTAGQAWDSETCASTTRSSQRCLGVLSGAKAMAPGSVPDSLALASALATSRLCLGMDDQCVSPYHVHSRTAAALVVKQDCAGNQGVAFT